MAWNTEAEYMKIFNYNENAQAFADAEAARPQLERYIDVNMIYVIETLADYDSLPTDVKAWRTYG